MTTQRHRPPRAAVALAVMAAGGLAAAEAEAGAWTREPGDLQVISTFGHHGAPLRAGEDDDDVETVTSQIYAEYGLIEGLTVGGKFWTDIAPGDVDAGSAALGGFVRKRLWRSDGGSVVSAQVGALAPIESLLDEDFGRSKPFSTTEIELRVGRLGQRLPVDRGRLSDPLRGSARRAAPRRYRRHRALRLLHGAPRRLWPAAGQRGPDRYVAEVRALAGLARPGRERRAGDAADLAAARHRL